MAYRIGTVYKNILTLKALKARNSCIVIYAKPKFTILNRSFSKSLAFVYCSERILVMLTVLSDSNSSHRFKH